VCQQAVPLLLPVPVLLREPVVAVAALPAVRVRASACHGHSRLLHQLQELLLLAECPLLLAQQAELPRLLLLLQQRRRQVLQLPLAAQLAGHGVLLLLLAAQVRLLVLLEPVL
jgi:hypothetical protein